MEQKGRTSAGSGRPTAQPRRAQDRATGAAISRTPAVGRCRHAPISLTLDHSDRHRPLLIVAFTGLGIGVLLAVFGLPPINMGDPLQLVGIVCPFCGGTRALQHLFLGDAGLAWRYNPLSVLLVAGAVGVLVRYVVGTLSGWWPTVRMRWNAATIAVLTASLGVLWVNQLLHTELLLT